MDIAKLVAEISPGKNSGPYEIWTHDICDTGTALYQLSQQVNWLVSLDELLAWEVFGLFGNCFKFSERDDV